MVLEWVFLVCFFVDVEDLYFSLNLGLDVFCVVLEYGLVSFFCGGLDNIFF